MQQPRQQQRPPNNIRAAAAPYRKPFRAQGHGHGQSHTQQNQMMYSSCQIPSDPLYVDFNRPAPPPNAAQQMTTGSSLSGQADGGKKKLLKGKQLKGSKQLQHHAHNLQFEAQMHGPSGDNNWKAQQHLHPHPHQSRFHAPSVNRFNGPQRNGFVRGPMGAGPAMGRHMMGAPMGPSPLSLGPRRQGPVGGSGPMPPYPSYQSPMPPMRCPMPPMGGPPPPPPPPPPFMRRGLRAGGPPRPPLPPALMGPHMMGPRGMRPRGMPPGVPSPFNMNMSHMNGSVNGRKIKKPNPKLVKMAVKGKSTIKTLKNLVNQYPIDKPWVNHEIRAIYDEKQNIENRLKGNKDDELFAQFKVQRDKFVTMYEEAREAYLKQEAASVMAKDAKDKDKNANANANSNQNDIGKVGNTNPNAITDTDINSNSGIVTDTDFDTNATMNNETSLPCSNIVIEKPNAST